MDRELGCQGRGMLCQRCGVFIVVDLFFPFLKFFFGFCLMLVCPEGFFRVVVGTGCAVSNAFVDWSWCLQGEIHRKLGGFDGNFHPNKTSVLPRKLAVWTCCL